MTENQSFKSLQIITWKKYDITLYNFKKYENINKNCSNTLKRSKTMCWLGWAMALSLFSYMFVTPRN